MRQRAVTSEQIVAAADVVAARLGMSGITIREICAELHVTSPAIYRHFPSKALIVSELVDRIIGRTELPGPDAGDWIDRIRRYFLSVHDAVAPYPGLAAQIGTRFPAGPAADRNTAYADELVSTAGIDYGKGERVLSMLFFYVWGHLLAARPLGFDPAESRDRFLWGLDFLLGAARREFGTGTRREIVRSPFKSGRSNSVSRG